MIRAALVFALLGTAWAQVTDAEVDAALSRRGCRRTKLEGRVVSFKCAANVLGHHDLTNLDLELKRANAAERARLIESFFVGPTDNAAELPKKQLFVILKPKAVLESEMARAREMGHPIRIAGIPWIGDLLIIPVVDTPTSQSFVTREHTEKWKSSIEEALVIGSENLDKLEHRPLRRKTPGGRPMAAYASDDGYDAARVLSEVARREIEKLLGGAAVYAVPRRDLLLAVRSDDAAAIADLRKLAVVESREHHPLGTELFSVEGNVPKKR